MDVISDPQLNAGKSPSKIIFGLILLIAAIGLITWNEEEPAYRYKVYQDGPGNATVLPAPQINSANDGRLVYFTGPVISEAILRDRQLGMEAKAIKIKRKILLYQWAESKIEEPASGTDGGQVMDIDGQVKMAEKYKYEKGWYETLNETLSFKKPINSITGELRVNPSHMIFQPDDVTVSEVKIGDFVVPVSAVAQFSNYEKLPVPEENIENFPEDWKTRVKIVDGEYYIGRGTLEAPQVGDYRISYEAVMPGFIATVLGKQHVGTIEPYLSQYNGALREIKVGAHSLEEMFSNLPKADPIMEWGGRVVAIIIAFIGAKIFLSGLNSYVPTILLVLLLVPFAFGFAWSSNELVSYVCLGVSGVALILLLVVSFKHMPNVGRLSSRSRKAKDDENDFDVKEVVVEEDLEPIQKTEDQSKKFNLSADNTNQYVQNDGGYIEEQLPADDIVEASNQKESYENLKPMADNTQHQDGYNEWTPQEPAIEQTDTMTGNEDDTVYTQVETPQSQQTEKSGEYASQGAATEYGAQEQGTAGNSVDVYQQNYQENVATETVSEEAEGGNEDVSFASVPVLPEENPADSSDLAQEVSNVSQNSMQDNQEKQMPEPWIEEDEIEHHAEAATAELANSEEVVPSLVEEAIEEPVAQGEAVIHEELVEQAAQEGRQETTGGGLEFATSMDQSEEKEDKKENSQNSE